MAHWASAVVVVASNKPNPAQIMEKLNNVDSSYACESCYGMYLYGISIASGQNCE